jgi:hypothetical protein
VRNLGGNPGQPITIDLVKGFQVIYHVAYQLWDTFIVLPGCRLGQRAFAEAAGD